LVTVQLPNSETDAQCAEATTSQITLVSRRIGGNVVNASNGAIHVGDNWVCRHRWRVGAKKTASAVIVGCRVCSSLTARGSQVLIRPQYHAATGLQGSQPQPRSGDANINNGIAWPSN